LMKDGLKLNTIDSSIQAFSQQRPIVDTTAIIDHQKRSDKFSKIRKKLWNQPSIKTHQRHHLRLIDPDRARALTPSATIMTQLSRTIWMDYS
ncbi:unnamed protein product, partial [Oikopleura dioica]